MARLNSGSLFPEPSRCLSAATNCEDLIFLTPLVNNTCMHTSSFDNDVSWFVVIGGASYVCGWSPQVCYDLAHQISWAKHTVSGLCDITPMVCCSFGGHSTPQVLQCRIQTLIQKSTGMDMPLFQLFFFWGCDRLVRIWKA